MCLKVFDANLSSQFTVLLVVLVALVARLWPQTGFLQVEATRGSRDVHRRKTYCKNNVSTVCLMLHCEYDTISMCLYIDIYIYINICVYYIALHIQKYPVGSGTERVGVHTLLL